MTEREYVDKIRKAASEHLEQIGRPACEQMDPAPIRRWLDIQPLSAHTTIRLCDAWLKMHEDEE